MKQSVQDFLHQGTAESLGLLRIIVFGLCLGYVLYVPLTQLAALPPDVFQPPGLIKLLPEGILSVVLTAPGLAVLKFVTAALLLAALLGLRPFRGWALPAVAAFVVFEGVLKGHGTFINHAQFGILYLGLLLAFFPAADRFSVQGRPKTDAPDALYRAGPICAGFVLTLPYAVLGIRRIAENGSFIFLDDTILNYLTWQSINPSAYGFTYGLIHYEYAWIGLVFKAGFALVTLLEVVAPLILFMPRFRWIWLLVMVPFHVSTLFTMNIFFWENCILLLALFTVPLYRVGQGRWAAVKQPSEAEPSSLSRPLASPASGGG